MSVVTQDFVAAGKPTYIVANAGVKYTDITDGMTYQQTTIPYGKNWKLISNQNVYVPTTGKVNTVTASSPMQSSGGINPNLSMPKADATTDGYLSSADWNTFNSGTGGVPTTRAINTTAPLQGGGDLSADRTFSITQAGSLTDGFLSAADWGVFNSKFPYPTGTSSQYVRGDGSLATFPTIPSVTPAALTNTDDTNVTLALTGTPSSALLQAVNIAVGWSGTLADSRIASASTWNSKVSSVGATGPITSSGGTTPNISTSMNTNKLIGRSTAGTGVMEEISVGSGLSLSAGTLSASINQSITHATASGTDTYTATITGVTSYADGDCYLIRFTNGNTTGATLNINSIGAATLYRNNDGVLIGGDIVDGAEMLCIYNTTLTGFQCIGVAPNTLLAYVTNAEAITITKGQPVYVSGGTGDRIKVKLAYNTTDATSAQTIGVVQSTSIAANQKGLVIVQGQLDGLSLFPTSTWADGDYIYLGATAGTITNVKPSAPNHLVYLGYVTTASNGAAGRWYVKVQNGYELKELHDVQANSPTNKDTLYYDSSVSQWKANSIDSILGYTPVTNARTISTTSPLTGGGDLTANRTLAINQATTSADGYLSSTDWKIFNSKPNYITTNNWNLAVQGGNSLSTITLNLNTIKFYKIYITNTVTVTRLGCNVTAAGTAGSRGRLGIYSDVNGAPSALILDSGEFTCDSIAAKTLTGLSATLPAGVAWLCIVHNSATAPTFSSHPVGNLYPLASLAPNGGNNANYTHYSGTFTYAALPATTGALTLGLLTTAVPAVYFYT